MKPCVAEARKQPGLKASFTPRNTDISDRRRRKDLSIFMCLSLTLAVLWARGLSQRCTAGDTFTES